MTKYIRCIKAHIPVEIQRFRIMLVGEAPGKDEEIKGRPFVGSSGDYLNEVLKLAKLRRKNLFITNIFHCRPPQNKIAEFFSKEKSGKDWADSHPLRGTYLKKGLSKELVRLREEITGYNPDLIISLGLVSFWGLCGLSHPKDRGGQIGQLTEADICDKLYPLLPLYHPSYYLRSGAVMEQKEWQSRMITASVKEIREIA